MPAYINLSATPDAVLADHTGIVSIIAEPSDRAGYNNPNANLTISRTRSSLGHISPIIAGVTYPDGRPIPRFTPTLVCIKEGFADILPRINPSELNLCIAALECFVDDYGAFSSPDPTNINFERTSAIGRIAQKNMATLSSKMLSLYRIVNVPQPQQMLGSTSDAIFYRATAFVLRLSPGQVRSIYQDIVYSQPVWLHHQGHLAAGVVQMFLKMWVEVFRNRLRELQIKRGLRIAGVV